MTKIKAKTTLPLIRRCNERCFPNAGFNGTAMSLALLSVFSISSPQHAVAEGLRMVEEIIVTARKREESLQEVPVAVNVLTEASINSQRIEGIQDVGAIVPGLVTTKAISGTSGNIYLRGVGTGSSTPLVDQAVAINLDGVGINSAQLMSAGMFDLQQIEVLRGPQALFYGKNSPGGVIAIHTKDPTDEVELELSAAYEMELEEPMLRAIISGPFTDTFAGRLSLGWSEAGAHPFDIVNFDRFETGPTGEPVQTAFDTGSDPVETETVYAMGTLHWAPSDNLSAKLKYAHLRDEQDGSAYYHAQRTACGLGTAQVLYPVDGIDHCKKDNKVISAGLNPVVLAASTMFPDHTGNGFFNSKNDFGVLEINYEMDSDLTFTSVSGYFDTHEERLGEATFQVASGLIGGFINELEQWSQEFRLRSSYEGPVNFTLGAFYENKEINSDNEVLAGSNILVGLLPPVSVIGIVPVPFGRQVSRQEGVSYSVFGQLDWEISDKTTLSVGGRYSYEEKEAATRVSFSAAPGMDIPYLDDKPDWDNFSPEITLSHNFNEDVMFFASYKTAFKSGGFDGGYKADVLVQQAAAGIPYDNTFDEEQVSGFEIGVKSTLFDDTLRVNATAYSYDYEDMQLSKFAGGEGAQAISTRVINAAEASLDGIELETFWVSPVDGLTLGANVAWAKSEYDNYIADCFVGQTIAMGCDVNPDPVSGNYTGADLSGESLPMASDLSATFLLDYGVAVGRHWNLALNITASYKSDFNPTSEMYPDAWQQDSYWWTNASASLISSDNKWELYVKGVNLGDELFAATGANAPFSGNVALTGTDDPSGLADFVQWISGGRQVTFGVSYRM